MLCHTRNKNPGLADDNPKCPCEPKYQGKCKTYGLRDMIQKFAILSLLQIEFWMLSKKKKDEESNDILQKQELFW